jgi:hypothetical protein
VKRASLAVVSLLLALGGLGALSAFLPDSGWGKFVKDDRMVFLLERALYERKGDPYFYVYVRAINQTRHSVGIDVRETSGTFFRLDHWGHASEAKSGILSFMKPAILEKLDDDRRRDILQAYRSHVLTLVPRGQTLNYFVDFSHNTRDELGKQPGKFLFLSIRGQTFFSDGTDVWDERADYQDYLDEPVTWKQMPENALVLR